MIIIFIIIIMLYHHHHHQQQHHRHVCSSNSQINKLLHDDITIKTKFYSLTKGIIGVWRGQNNVNSLKNRFKTGINSRREVE